MSELEIQLQESLLHLNHHHQIQGDATFVRLRAENYETATVPMCVAANATNMFVGDMVLS